MFEYGKSQQRTLLSIKLTLTMSKAEIKETIRLEYLFKRQTSYLDFVRTKGNRHRLALIVTLGLFSQWSGNGLASFAPHCSAHFKH